MISLDKSHLYRRIFASSLATTLLATIIILGFTPKFAFAQAEYGEYLQLAQQVAAGELPPVHERLPKAPLVVEPVESIGIYGGDWNTGILGAVDTHWMARTIGGETLVRANDLSNPDKLVPNVAEAFEVNEEGNVFTFYLREGMKWSDGHPFTADDIVFWYEDRFMNDALTPVKNAYMISGGEVAVVEKLDDYTVRFTFAEPHGLFLELLSTIQPLPITLTPKHYLKQFHIDYNPEGIDELVRAEGAPDWVGLFNRKASWQENSDMPTLHAWQVTSGVGEGGGTSRVVSERNPYYWKVDTEGNQLPYIDRVIYTMAEDSEVLVLRAISGDIDFMSRHLNTLDNKAVFADHMDTARIRFFDIVEDSMNTTIIAFNLNHNDPVKREIYQNKDFRIGLSYAIDRQEIIDLIYVGQGEPWQASPRPETIFQDEEMAKQYTEYDPDLANEYLDRAGYSERDRDGFRLGPDGNRISITVELHSGYSSEWVSVVELVQRYWRDVGIEMHFRDMDRSLLSTRINANEHDVSIWRGYGGLDVLARPRWFFPLEHRSDFAMLWQYWYHGDPRGEEPPSAPRRQMELYDQVTMTSDSDKQIELMKELLQISKEEFYTIGISLSPAGYGIASQNLRNVPDVIIAKNSMSPANVTTSQFFFDNE